jgi:eukaryotic-like serine/threonine-protein kinase
MSQGAERWQQARQHFRRLCDLEESERRCALEALASADPELAAYVADLIAADSQGGEGLVDVVAGLREDFEEHSAGEPGGAVGPWTLLERIGHGGMGDVWKARRDDAGFEQFCALKLLKRGMDSEALLARFLQERRILARLEHPNIARLLDGGISASGRPWFAMELVEGQAVDRFVHQRRLDLPALLELLLRICAAVEFAHRNLVVHRDLKPSNILVDAHGEPKLLDFGIAKLLQGEESSQATVTATALRALTPAYAAPEQILGEPVSTATDVYALGVILYELLTGRRPHQRSAQAASAALAGALEAEEVTRPSLALLRSKETDGRAARRLAKLLRGDVDTIVLTALRREPGRRYPSAAAMAEDLRRHLEGQPIRARPDTTGYRMGKFLRRHRLGLATTTLVILALASGLAVAIWQGREARAQAQRAEAVQGFLLDIFRSNTSRQPDPVRARETTARELLDLGAERVHKGLDDAPAAKFAVLSVLGSLYQELAVDAQAVEMRRQALALARSLHGNRSLETAQALIDLAVSLHASADVGERGAVLDEAASILERQHKAPPTMRADLHRFAAEHYSSTDITRALDHATRAVSILGDLPPSVNLAEASYVKGVAHLFAEDIVEANAAFERAVEVSLAAQGFPNPSLPRFNALLSRTRYRLLDFPGALESSRQALAAASLVSGPEHADTLQTTMRLGRLLFDTGSTHEGLEHLAQARRIALDTRGAEDPFHTPQARLEYGFALLRAGDPAAGLEEILAAIENRRIHRPGTPFLAQMLEFAAMAMMQLDRGEEAGALLDEAGAIRDGAGQQRGTMVWNHHAAQRARHAAAAGRHEEALSWLAEFQVPPAAATGPTLEGIERDVLRAEVLWSLARGAESAESAAAALAAISDLDLDGHLSLQRARALHIRGRALLASGELEAGCTALHEADALAGRLLLPPSPQLAAVRSALEDCLAR